ncbi:4-(cytidine 5'-diphospho)-2-C-methyl-D-erythritol kinase [Bythopirellula polymerisocia]|uniref:4-diphosphocytidyl-2-C-methyl-D-erythritol kinase n=1 Tax=Bythopirellula polymerisocia TaxID=2528003 RepID=A0A5C6CUQ8_9BACT|nr:4-(cytidine 5'-diphospho)-2-C-methyl-D-erythritol kinase [Bythopirellula polymerisocia]TWU28262.1 4-diphosphocytidyl-2-C-methyl-D-erythritol kinase [Bythopirellula polymerisocia]
MVPRKVGTDWEVLAPAKLNLYLQVQSKRSDGFHDLETLMVPVRLFDHLRWSPSNSGNTAPAAEIGSEGLSFSVDARALNLHPEQVTSLESSENLVPRAARLLATRIGCPPRGHFQLTKRIPLQAGLGGGSSDAAATLRLANACWNGGLSEVELTDIAAQLGSDVPFFLQDGPAVCRGRGELVSTTSGLPKMHFVLVKPPLGLSTAAVFQEVAALPERESLEVDRLSKLLETLQIGAVGAACQWMTNRLEAIAAQMAPEVLRIKASLRAAGCWGQMMTGSGSTVFGIARSATHARWIARRLTAQRIGTVFVTSSGW